MSLGERLRQIRLGMKLTLETVSERTGLGVSTLSEFENVVREPRLGQLKQLADVYHRSLAYFLDDTPPPTERVLWRERPPSPVAEDLQATLLDLADRYRSLEVLCGEPTEFELPQVNEKAERFSYPAAARLARRVRSELGLGDRPGQTLLRVLEEVCHIKVFHVSFEPSGSAACALSERFGAAVLLNAKNVRWRRNFDLGHEFFHLLTWRVFGHDAGSSLDVPSDQEEKLATCFARNLLMPEEVFREAVDAQRRGTDRLSFDDLFKVAREFDVSVEAVLWQLSFLYRDRLSPERAKSLIEQLRGQIGFWDERERDTPPGRPLRFLALARQALRDGLISTGRYAECVGISRREAMRVMEEDGEENVQIELSAA